MLDTVRLPSGYFQRNVGASLKRVAWDHTAVIVTNNGRDMAALISMDEFRAYLAWRREWERHAEIDTSSVLRSLGQDGGDQPGAPSEDRENDPEKKLRGAVLEGSV